MGYNTPSADTTSAMLCVCTGAVSTLTTASGGGTVLPLLHPDDIAISR